MNYYCGATFNVYDSAVFRFESCGTGQPGGFKYQCYDCREASDESRRRSGADGDVWLKPGGAYPFRPWSVPKEKEVLASPEAQLLKRAEKAESERDELLRFIECFKIRAEALMPRSSE